MPFVEQHRLANHRNIVRIGAFGERLSHIMPVLSAALANLHFDQFVIEKCLFKRGDHTIGDALFSHGDDGLEVVPQRL